MVRLISPAAASIEVVCTVGHSCRRCFCGPDQARRIVRYSGDWRRLLSRGNGDRMVAARSGLSGSGSWPGPSPAPLRWRQGFTGALHDRPPGHKVKADGAGILDAWRAGHGRRLPWRFPAPVSSDPPWRLRVPDTPAASFEGGGRSGPVRRSTHVDDANGLRPRPRRSYPER